MPCQRVAVTSRINPSRSAAFLRSPPGSQGQTSSHLLDLPEYGHPERRGCSLNAKSPACLTAAPPPTSPVVYRSSAPEGRHPSHQRSQGPERPKLRHLVLPPFFASQHHKQTTHTTEAQERVGQHCCGLEPASARPGPPKPRRQAQKLLEGAQKVQPGAWDYQEPPTRQSANDTKTQDTASAPASTATLSGAHTDQHRDSLTSSLRGRALAGNTRKNKPSAGHLKLRKQGTLRTGREDTIKQDTRLKRAELLALLDSPGPCTIDGDAESSSAVLNIWTCRASRKIQGQQTSSLSLESRAFSIRGWASQDTRYGAGSGQELMADADIPPQHRETPPPTASQHRY